MYRTAWGLVMILCSYKSYIMMPSQVAPARPATLMVIQREMMNRRVYLGVMAEVARDNLARAKPFAPLQLQ